MNTFSPVHPDEILQEEFLSPIELTRPQLASAIKVPVSQINAIIAGNKHITADLALRLGRLFGTSTQFWMNLQNQINLAKTLEKSVKQIEPEVKSFEYEGE